MKTAFNMSSHLRQKREGAIRDSQQEHNAQEHLVTEESHDFGRDHRLLGALFSHIPLVQASPSSRQAHSTHILLSGGGMGHTPAILLVYI